MSHYPTNISLLASLLGALTFCAYSQEAPPEAVPLEPGFVSLFNGQDTTGWQLGEGQPLVVEEGSLTGNPLGPGLSITEETYKDFVLRLEYWTDRGETHEANGGVYFRIGGGEDPSRGFEAQISSQDPDNPSGSIYGRVPQDIELMRTIAPEKQWNKVEIRAIGPRIQVWYNDQQVQDATWHEFPNAGHIGLQHHHNGCIIKYRNIRIQQLSPADAEPGWEAFALTPELEGFVATGASNWEVKDGVLHGTGGLGNLYYMSQQFADFELRAMARINPKGNSGLVVRSRGPEGESDGFAVGYEYQIDNWDARNESGPKNTTGSIYGFANAPLLTHDNVWFSLRIRAVGDHIQSWINGRLITDFHDSTHTSGYFAVQSFFENTHIQFRDVFFRDLTPPPAPTPTPAPPAAEAAPAEAPAVTENPPATEEAP